MQKRAYVKMFYAFTFIPLMLSDFSWEKEFSCYFVKIIFYSQNWMKKGEGDFL